MALTTTRADNVTAHATAHTKGAYVELTSATPYASSRIYFFHRWSSAANKFYLVDLATGAAGAETVVVANLHIAASNESLSGAVVALDLDLPAGTRLAVRCQSNIGSSPIGVSVILEARALAGLAAPVTYGTVLASSRGTQVDPGAVAATKGAYVQLTAATTARIDALVLDVTVYAATPSINAFHEYLVDVATGAAGAETIILPDVPFLANSVSDAVYPQLVRLPASIPAGTRLAVRVYCSLATVNVRILCVTLIGVQEPAAAVGVGGALAVAYVG